MTISTQCQFKSSVPQTGIRSSTLFNIYTSEIPTPKQLITYGDDITITVIPSNIQTTKAHIPPYLRTIHT